ncbi:hypothetical protein ES708_02652 [subsurface metagenome]
MKAGSVAPTSANSDRNNICPGDGSIILSYTGGTLGTGATARWYSDTALTVIVGAGNDLSLPVPIATTAYFVRFEGDCDSSAAVGTLVSINALTIDPDTAYADRDSICPGDGNITLSYSGGDPGSNGSAVWYADSALIAIIGTGNDMSIAAPVISTTYFVRFEADCDSSAAVGFRLSVNLLSVAPDSAYTDRDTICSGDGNIVLSYGGGSSGTSAVATWYDDAAMSSSIGTGNDLSIPAPLATSDYFVRLESGCDTTTAATVKVYVLAFSMAPVSASSDRDTICPADGIVILSYTGGTLGDQAVARWYSDPLFTFPEGEGNDLVIIAPVNSTTYYVRFEGPCENTAAVSTVVIVLPASIPPSGVITDRDNLCPGDGTVTLTYTGGSFGAGARAVWYADTASASIGTGSSIVVNTPDSTSTWYVRFEGDCDTTVAVPGMLTIKTFSVVPASASADRDSVCAGIGLITLSYSGGVQGTGAVARWYDNASLANSIGTGNNLSISVPDASTTYYVRFEGDCDTTTTASVALTIFSIPAPVFTEKTEDACTNGPLYRYVVSGQPGSVFTWSITNGTIVNNYNDTVFVDWGAQTRTGSLEVTETTTDGCISSPVGVEVTIGGPSIDLGENLEICVGTPTTITPAGDFTTHMWHDGSTGPTYTTDTTEMVRIQVFDDAGCTAFDSVQVTAYPTPVVVLGNDTTLCGEMSLTLDAGNPGSIYNWSTGETTQQIEVFAGEQLIWVEVMNVAGCSDSASIMIRPCSPKEFFANIANTFTPNGDNVNDTWQIDEVAAYPNIDIEIFDRWGKLVWKSVQGYAVEWDGKNTKGKDMPMDSYYYVINLNDGSDKITGTITIMR